MSGPEQVSQGDVHFTVRGRIAHVTIDRPPVNSLDRSTRQALVDAFTACAADPQVQAIVLAGANGNFCAGADINELNDPDTFFAPPRIVDVARCIEDCPKPVVAAIEGNCLGGGLEIALAAHFRVADARAMLGLPEIRIGVLPAAGGTQRLARMIGLESALGMMLDGNLVSARELAATPLLGGLAIFGGALVAGLALLAAATGFCTGCEAYKLGSLLIGRPFVSCPLPTQPGTRSE